MLVVTLAVSCRQYDPIAQVPHRIVGSVPAALRMIIAENGGAKVFAVGEYHPTRKAHGSTSPSAIFRRDMLPVFELLAKHLLIESWIDDGTWSAPVSALAQQVTLDLDRPQHAALAPATAAPLSTMTLHLLQMTAIEQDGLFDARGQVDFLRLLTTVTDKLGSTALRLVQQHPHDGVVIYGGALHNDLYPAWPLESLSYAPSLQQQLAGGVVEIDIVVPEIVADNAALFSQSWFPLLAIASPDSVIVVERGPHSYVVITQTSDVSTLGGLRLPKRAINRD
jgi:hypothetical protein